MDIIVALAAIAGLVFSWRKVSIKLNNRMWIIRHAAGSICGVFIFTFIIGFSLSLGIIEPADPNNVQKTVKVEAEKTPEKKKVKFKYENMLLSEYMNESKSTRYKIAEVYVKVNKFPDTAVKLFHTCLSDMSRNKSQTHTVGKMMEWCLTDYTNDPDSMLVQYLNYDAYENQFSKWDSSHYKSVALIKSLMNDPSSYKHVNTNHRLVMTGPERYTLVSTTFRARNGFGGIVTHTIVTKANIYTGDIIEVVEQR